MDLGFMQAWRHDAAASFQASGQAEAAALLLDCLRAGDPIVVMTGASGLGKTAVLDSVLSQLGAAEPRVLRLAEPFPTALGLQRCLAEMLGLAEPDEATPADLASVIVGLPAPSPGVASLAVVVDDAEAIPAPLLQYLWLMHSLACQARPVLQLILVGRDGLWRRLGDDRLSGLRRGVSARLAMQPLPAVEAEAFLRYLLKSRGRRADPEALAEMRLVGGGVPGRLVTLLDAACAGLPRGRTVSLDRVRLALGRPPAPARHGWRRRGGALSAWAVRSLGRPGRRVALLGAGAAGVLLVLVSWHMQSGAGSAKPLAATPIAAAALPSAPAAPAPVVVRREAPPPAEAPEAVPRDLAAMAAVADAIGSGAGEAAALVDRSLKSLAWQAARPSPVVPDSRPPRVDAGVVLPALTQPLPPIPSPAVSVEPAPPAKPAAPPSAPLLVLSDATALHVVVQYARGDPRAEERAARAVALLRASGMDTADPQPAGRGAPRGVGYYFHEDRAGAEAVARALSDLGGHSSVKELPLRGDLPAPGAIDVVIGGRA